MNEIRIKPEQDNSIIYTHETLNVNRIYIVIEEAKGKSNIYILIYNHDNKYEWVNLNEMSKILYSHPYQSIKEACEGFIDKWRGIKILSIDPSELYELLKGRLSEKITNN